MILPDFQLTTRKNKIWKYSGIDSIIECNDKKHFIKYPHKIRYNYNSRGFRDNEWAETLSELKECIWCFGDSFTVGVGSPLKHTWVNILQQQSGMRCINISMDGASNQWIARKIKRVIDVINPTNIIVQWSYLDRYEDDKPSIDEHRRRHSFNIKESPKQKIYRFKKYITPIRNKKIIHSFIPDFDEYFYPNNYFRNLLITWCNIKGKDWHDVPKNLEEFNNLTPMIISELKKFNEYKNVRRYSTFPRFYRKILNVPSSHIHMINQRDYARDGHHYDKLTATEFISNILPLLK